MPALPSLPGQHGSRLFSRYIRWLRCHRSTPVDRLLCALRLSVEFAFVQSLQPGQGANAPKRVPCVGFLSTGSQRSLGEPSQDALCTAERRCKLLIHAAYSAPYRPLAGTRSRRRATNLSPAPYEYHVLCRYIVEFINNRTRLRAPSNSVYQMA